jgi:NAD(P)-dependent dehydrogenase (short-subunit alcohol dehydrogenase family)
MKKKTLLVTGAAGGIGRAAIMRMSRTMHVIAADSDHFGLIALVDGLDKKRRYGVSAVEVDVRSADSVRRMMRWIDKNVGPVHALFNNAGVGLNKAVEAINEAEWDLLMQTHVKGAYLCSQAILAQMCERKRGVIVNMSSDFAIIGGAGATAYAAAQSAVYTLTKTLALEFAPYGIRVNALGPGPIDTPLLRSCRADEPWQETEKRIINSVPMARLGRPEEVAAVLEFLLSERSAYITGQIIHPNGGAVSW